MIDVLIDESFQRIDKKLVKVNICAVETNRGLIQKSIQEIQEYVLKDKIRFPNTKDKFHFSSLNEGQKALIVDKISKLDFDSKIFTYYLFDTTESVTLPI